MVRFVEHFVESVGGQSNHRQRRQQQSGSPNFSHGHPHHSFSGNFLSSTSVTARLNRLRKMEIPVVIPSGARNLSVLKAKKKERFLVAPLLGMTRFGRF